MKKITLLCLSLFLTLYVGAQCTTSTGGQWPNQTITPSGDSVTTISTCNFANAEFSLISGITPGDDYEVTITNGNYITVTNTADGSVITHGAAVVNFTAPAGVTDLTIYWHVDAACTDGSTACETTTIQCTTCAPPPVVSGDTCATATAITVGTNTCGPLATDTTNGATDSDLDSPAPPAASCTAYAGGDVWFSLVVPASGNVNISGDASGCCSFLWYEVYEGADCSSLTSIMCSNTTSNNPSEFEMALTGRTPGETLWIRAWDSNNDNGPGSVNFCAYDPPSAPDCAETPIVPADTATDVPVNTPTTLEWTAPSSGITPTSYNIYVGTMSDGSDQALLDNSVGTTYDVTWIVYDTTIYWSVRPLNGTSEATGCPLWSFTTESAPPPPSNDNLCNATPISMNSESSGGTYTSVSATAETGEIEGSCFNGGINGSVWFSFVAPASGEVRVSTDLDNGGTHADTEIAVYEAPVDCNDASTLGAEVGCDQDGGTVGSGFLSTVDLVGLTPGNTYYIQVDRWGTAADGTFDLFVFDTTTLSIDNPTQTNAFKYFPNPVTNTLSLRAQNTIESVAIYNMIGQEIKSALPNDLQSDIDLADLSQGTYFVKVTVNGVTETVQIIKR